ncbi:peptidylprolyl isomerase [candidate division KSB1 bacterium]|nr:peptidylprolyl isomerase [candidate division KSB1 bacterium]
MSKINKAIWISAFLISLFFWGCKQGNGNDEVVARAGNTSLTRSMIENQMAREGIRPEQESQYVEKWIDRQLLYEEAKRLGFHKSSDMEYELELLEKEILINKLLEATFSERIQIDEEEIEAAYENSKDLFQVLEEDVRILHILTETRQEANLAAQEIRAGMTFEEVAQQHSIDVFKDLGGDMGYIRQRDVIPEVARNAFRLREDAVSQIFQSDYGYHIIKVLDKRSKGETKRLPDVRDEIRERIRVNKERNVYYDLLYQLQNRSKVYFSPAYQTQDTESGESMQGDQPKEGSE